jgi:putative membrane protein
MLYFFIRWVAATLALLLAQAIVPGIEVASNAQWFFGVTAAVIGLVNALIRPVLKLLACGFILPTLVAFSLVVNGLVLWLSSTIAVNQLNIPFQIHGFWAVFWGALAVSVVTAVLSLTFRDREPTTY